MQSIYLWLKTIWYVFWVLHRWSSNVICRNVDLKKYCMHMYHVCNQLQIYFESLWKLWRIYVGDVCSSNIFLKDEFYEYCFIKFPPGYYDDVISRKQKKSENKPQARVGGASNLIWSPADKHTHIVFGLLCQYNGSLGPTFLFSHMVSLCTMYLLFVHIIHCIEHMLIYVKVM